MNIEITATPTLPVAPPRPAPATIVVRPPARDDLAAVERHFERLDGEARRLRFHGATNVVPRVVLNVFRDADQHTRITRVAVAGSTVLGEAMLVSAPGSAEGELAISVAASCRRTGIGRRLLSSLLARAARMGLLSLHADVLPENDAFIALAGALGFAKRRHPQDPALLRMTRVIAPRDADRRAVAPLPRDGAWCVQPPTTLPRPRDPRRADDEHDDTIARTRPGAPVTASPRHRFDTLHFVAS